MNGKLNVRDIEGMRRDIAVLDSQTSFYAKMTIEINSSGTGQGKRDLFGAAPMQGLIDRTNGDELAEVLKILRHVQARRIREAAETLEVRYGVKIADLEKGFAVEDQLPGVKSE